MKYKKGMFQFFHKWFDLFHTEISYFTKICLVSAFLSSRLKVLPTKKAMFLLTSFVSLGNERYSLGSYLHNSYLAVKTYLYHGFSGFKLSPVQANAVGVGRHCLANLGKVNNTKKQGSIGFSDSSVSTISKSNNSLKKRLLAVIRLSENYDAIKNLSNRFLLAVFPSIVMDDLGLPEI